MGTSKPEEHSERTWRYPQVVPGSQAILFMGSNSGGTYEAANIEVLNHKTRQIKAPSGKNAFAAG